MLTISLNFPHLVLQIHVTIVVVLQSSIRGRNDRHSQCDHNVEHGIHCLNVQLHKKLPKTYANMTLIL